MMKSGAGYIRLSQLRPGDTTLAPETQRQVIRDYAAAQGVEITDWYEDLDVSGKDTGRPALARLRANWGHYDVAMSAKIDRWARSVRDFTSLVQESSDAGCAMVAVRDNLDMSTPIGRFVATILAAFAEMELAVITERIKAGKATARAAGRWNGGTVPYGLRVEDHQLVPDDAESAVIREALTMLEQGASVRSVARAWNNGTLKMRNGGKGWHPSSVRRALLNPRLVPGVLSATESGWLHDRLETGAPAVPDARHLLSGLLRCGTCGTRMHRATTLHVNVYRCSASIIGHPCSLQCTISVPRIEPLIEALYLDRWCRVAETVERPLTDKHAELLAVLDAERRELRTRLAGLPVADLQAAAERLSQLEAEHNRLSANRPPVASVLVETGRTYGEAWAAADVEERRRMLAEWFGHLVIRNAGRRGRWATVAGRIGNIGALDPGYDDDDVTRDWVLEIEKSLPAR